MKKALLTLVLIFACALSVAAPFWIKAGMEDGFTVEAFDYGPSLWWTVGMFAFFVVAAGLTWCWKKVLEAGGGHVVD